MSTIQKLAQSLGIQDREILNELANLGNTFGTDAVISILEGVADTASAKFLPYWARPLARLMSGFVANTASSINRAELLEQLKTSIASQQDEAKKGTIGLQPEMERGSKENFGGFDEGNVVLFGVTQSGKTTSFVTWLYNEMITNYDMCVLIGSDLLKSEKIQEIRTAIQYGLYKQSKEFNQDVFSFFNRSQIDDGIDFATSRETSKQKLVFFDDIQLDNSTRKFDKVALFTQEAKHAKCTVYTSLHMSFNDKAAEIIRSSAKYFVLFNQHEQNFNRLLKLEKGNRLWRKYNMIVDIHERVLIHEIVTGKNFYGTWPYNRMDPLIASDEEGNM